MMSGDTSGVGGGETVRLGGSRSAAPRRFLAVSGLVMLAGIVFFLSVLYGIGHSNGDRTDEVAFTVEEGQDIFVLAGRLRSSGIIASRWPFLFQLFREASWKRIRAGEYRLSGRMSVPEIVGKLTRGETIGKGIRVTFPEGLTAGDMADLLHGSGLPGDGFLSIVTAPGPDIRGGYPFLSDLPAGASLEGYLFPDTYFFDPTGGADGIVRKMLDGFESKAWPTLSASGKRYDDLVLASILETEVRTSGDRRLVADLFLRRLDAGMSLQSDATVRYALGEAKVKHSLEDLEIDSPYNSYKYPGLPPGPVSNPGTDAIEAALHPTPNPYWYFLNNPETGETVFSVTFDEHVANKGRNGL